MYIHLEHSVRKYESSEGAVTPARGSAVTPAQLCAACYKSYFSSPEQFIFAVFSGAKILLLRNYAA